MKKKKYPFRRGQRIRKKGTKDKKYGIVMSNDWFTIGSPEDCRIPGGPLVIEGYIAVQWTINGKTHLCMDKAEEFEAF
tara:strand:+ start:544 stop:777 length:234 start_codon:yes stop_codon:yes gene_type:complete